MNKAQIGIIPLISIGSAIIIAAIGGFLAQSRYTDEKIDVVKTENTITVQRIAVLETDSTQYKKDIVEIKGDIKEILRLLK